MLENASGGKTVFVTSPEEYERVKDDKTISGIIVKDMTLYVTGVVPVHGLGTSSLRAFDGARVTAAGFTEVVALGGSRVLATESSRVHCDSEFEGEVVAMDTAHVWARGIGCEAAKVRAEHRAHVQHFGGCTVVACDDSFIETCALDDAVSGYVDARGRSRVVALSRSVRIQLVGLASLYRGVANVPCHTGTPWFGEIDYGFRRAQCRVFGYKQLDDGAVAVVEVRPGVALETFDGERYRAAEVFVHRIEGKDGALMDSAVFSNETFEEIYRVGEVFKAREKLSGTPMCGGVGFWLHLDTLKLEQSRAHI
jgi:hypothetical protein